MRGAFCVGPQSRLIYAQATRPKRTRQKGETDMETFSRRDTMAGLAAAGVLIPGMAFASDPPIPAATIAARQNAPVVPKKVNRLYNLAPTVKEPNDMQVAPTGELWGLDQVGANK